MNSGLQIKTVHTDAELELFSPVIRRAFLTVAEEFHLTPETAPTNPAYAGVESLIAMRDRGIQLYGAWHASRPAGFVALEDAGDGLFYLERLAVLPDLRHRGYGTDLIRFAEERARQQGGRSISIGIIYENTILRSWYIQYGFQETGTKSFPHLPFTVGFLKLDLI